MLTWSTPCGINCVFAQTMPGVFTWENGFDTPFAELLSATNSTGLSGTCQSNSCVLVSVGGMDEEHKAHLVRPAGAMGKLFESTEGWRVGAPKDAPEHGKGVDA
jgi:hypothetical protein